MKARRRSLKQAESLENIAEQSISLGIKTGEVEIEEQQKDLNQILLESRIRAEQDKIDDYQVRKRLIDAQLHYLNSQVSHRMSKPPENEEELEMSKHFTAVLSKK